MNKKYSRVYPETDGDDIVISGMSGKFPNSRNVAEYEHNLYNKIDMVDDDERRWRHFNPEVPKRAGKIYELGKFDATFFGVHFKQAHTMDPQCRILIEVAYEAIVDAGMNPKQLRGSKTGVIVGSCISESEKTWFYEKVTSGGFGITGCSRAMLANRISYSLGLNGPSFLCDTACSSSMYALDHAFSALRNGEIDAAIVGAANLILHPFVTLQFARLGVLAQDGYCRPFDKDACGYTRSEAINCIFLQRRRDAKRVYATVVYSKINCDGHKTEGITYPSGIMQEKLLRDFYDSINVSPNELGYLEAHSTGTVVGDPEECRAIDNVICSRRTEPLPVGSVKSNIGHSEPASGICSLVKAMLTFQTGKIPPNLNFKEIKNEIPALAEGRLQVVSEVQDLKKPYIGVSSFGFGGANAHALLKGFEKEKINFGLPEDNLPRLITWSGRTEESCHMIFNAMEQKPLDAEFVALLHNIQNEGIAGLVFRSYGIFEKNGRENAKCIAKEVKHHSGLKIPIVWVFSGMGSQWSQMGASLMEISLFKESITRCHNVLKPKGLDLIHILTSDDPTIYNNILHSFVGIAAIQIGLVDVLRALNLEPDYIIGHSVGELGCGYADGGFTAEQMILAAYYRGKVSCEVEKIKGSMAAVGLGYKNIIRMLPETIEVACHNGADSCTISGPCDDVAKFVEQLKSQDIFAKEVPCSNIAYHSRYIAHMGPLLLKYLKETIPNPKERSSKWLSTSVPKSQWDQPDRSLCSAEYHSNNLLSSVLFEETTSLLPSNALTIEIAPHGLLQAILKRSLPDGIHIGLTQRGNKNNSMFFLSALGKLYANGIDLPVERLYPKVEFPVSRGTASIASLIQWDHSEDWFYTKYENMKTNMSGERIYNMTLRSDDEEFLAGHVIDGKILVPATAYLHFVWETFALMYHGPSLIDLAVEFEDVRFLRATTLTKESNIELNVMVQYGTGHFEITEAGSLVCTGAIREIENDFTPAPLPRSDEPEIPMLSKKDFYKELKLRGYHYRDAFQAVHSCRGDGLYGKIHWNYNWVVFLDAMLQIHIIGTDSRTLLLPTKIQKLRINGSYHFKMMADMPPEERFFEIDVNHKFDRVVCGGVEMIGLHASPVQRRKPPGIPVLEKYQYLPHFPTPKLLTSDAIRVCVQLALENTPMIKMKVVEVNSSDCTPIINHFLDAFEDLPLVTGDYTLFTSQEVELTGIRVENGSNISSELNNHFIIMQNVIAKSSEFALPNAKCLVDAGYLVLRENDNIDISSLQPPSEYNIVAVLPTVENEILVLLQKANRNFHGQPCSIKISRTDNSFEWIKDVQTAIARGPVILYSQNEKYSGIMGLVNCLRKEPDGMMFTCVFIDDPRAPLFDMELPFYKNQLALGWGVNVYRNGGWGSYRHLQLIIENEIVPHCDHIYANLNQRGDLSTLKWFKGPLDVNDCQVKIAYSSINFRDVMLATGRLAIEIYGTTRIEQNCVLGFEYSGIDQKTGKRIMSMVGKGGVASYVHEASSLVWNIPDHWSLRDAATVPVVYITVYYAFFMAVDIRKGKSILIHAGTGGVGLAAIRVALAYGLEVYSTVSTPQKKQFLLNMFPQLKESNIGNSRDTSFEQMIQTQTNARGVDFVLNSLAEDKLLASLRCLGKGGHFLEIGKFDLASDNKIGLGAFLKELSFHAVFADNLLTAPKEQIMTLKSMVDNDIANSIIQPLPSTVFKASEIEQAFRYLAGGKHMGKVLIQVREDPNSDYTLPVKSLPQAYFNPKLVYIIPGGLGGFGLELADWMAIRGAKKLVLSSSTGIKNDYQSFRIALWKSYGCEVIVSIADITIKSGCEELLTQSMKLGPIGGIFNLAVTLRDSLFENQTPEKFLQSLAPKAMATIYLDELSRKLCPELEQFVIFSSVSCGRGNAGQTNYGMANSIMERIIEDRCEQGLPGKAIQWGAVGEVGLVAVMAEDKIDMEIGGTLQQRISSCLQELDMLLTSPDPIVASMVVAEKRVGRGGKENIIETVMNIMSIRDLKSVSLSTSLSEMGMDSLMAVEIKQTLERDFELMLTPQDLRALTFQKLQEYSDAKQKENSEVVKLTMTAGEGTQGMALLLRNFGDETNSDQIILPLKTKADASKIGNNPNIIIPGLEGIGGEAWYNIASNLQSNSMLLQLHHTSELKSIKEIANKCFDNVKALLKPSEHFYIISYSFGTFIGLQLVSMLEKAGYRGRLLLIDGAPHFLKKLATAHLDLESSDEHLYNLILAGIVSKIFVEESTELAMQTFLKLDTYEKKIAKFLEFVKIQSVYSTEYAITMLNAMFNRVKMAVDYNLEEIEQLTTPITLIRPSEVALVDIPEDYYISKLTKGKVIVKFIEGTHASMLENPMLYQIINNNDPAIEDDKHFEQELKTSSGKRKMY